MQTWILYALLSALFAALTAVLAKAGLKNINPDLATAVRTALVLLMLWGIVIAKGKLGELSSFTKSNWIFLALSGIATGFSWLFYYRAMQAGHVSEVNAIDKGSLVLVIILSFLFLKEPVSVKTLAGAGLVVAGMLVIVWK